MKALIGLVTSVAVGLTVAPRALPEVDALLGPSAQATAVATFALQVIAAGLCAYVALVLLALLLARLRLLPMAARRAVDRWTGGGLAGSLRRLVGASALTVGLLPLTPAAATPIRHQEAPVIQPMEEPPRIVLPEAPPPPILRPATRQEPPRREARPPADHASRGRHVAEPPVIRPVEAAQQDPPRRQAQPPPAAERPSDRPVPVEADLSVTVRPGDSFWTIAEDLVSLRLQRAPTDPEVIGPWRDLIAANRDALPDPADPDVLLPGTVLRLPVRAGW